MNDAAAIAKQSYNRSIGKDIIGRFYDIFLESHPDIGPMFSQTDFDAQKELLKHGIHLVIMFAGGNALGKAGLERIRESHSQSKLNIPPALYTCWKRSFLQAISETDSEFSDETREAWESVLQPAIDFIAGGYEAC